MVHKSAKFSNDMYQQAFISIAVIAFLVEFAAWDLGTLDNAKVDFETEISRHLSIEGIDIDSSTADLLMGMNFRTIGASCNASFTSTLPYNRSAPEKDNDTQYCRPHDVILSMIARKKDRCLEIHCLSYKRTIRYW